MVCLLKYTISLAHSETSLLMVRGISIPSSILVLCTKSTFFVVSLACFLDYSYFHGICSNF
jgi:hypothetical protein